MKKNLPTEFVFQLFALLISVIIVHAFYVALIRPEAAALEEEQNRMILEDPNFEVERSFYIIVKDLEQEACFVLMLWAFSIMGYKAWTALRESNLLDKDLMPIAEGMRILPADAREYARNIQALPSDERSLLLPRTLLTALHRFGATASVQDTSSTSRAVIETEAERLESEMSMVRYIAWAIPSIGFIGTVRGIGAALAQAHRAVEGDISGVTQSLGVAFNSTFIALLISIVLMFLIHQLQSLQERQIFETEVYVDENLIRHLQAA